MTSYFEYETIPWTGELMAQEGEFGSSEVNPEWEGEYGRGRRPMRSAPRPVRPPRLIPPRPRWPVRLPRGTAFPAIPWNGSAPIERPQADPADCTRCSCTRCSCARCSSGGQDDTPADSELFEFETSFGEFGETSGEWELGAAGEFETAGKAPATQKARVRYVKDFSGPAAECTAALRRAGKTRAEALAIINAQIGVAIAMLRKAATDLKRGSRSSATNNLFLKIFRVRPDFVPTWLKPTATIKDRGDVVATRCKRVADLLASGTLKYFCAINTTNCPDCPTPVGYACSSWGNDKVVCLGDDFWDCMKAGDTPILLAVLMHEPFHPYFGQYVTVHDLDLKRGKFGGVYCIQKFVFETNRRVTPKFVDKWCNDMKVNKELEAESQFAAYETGLGEYATHFGEYEQFETISFEAPGAAQGSGAIPYVRWVQASLNQLLGTRLATDGIAGAQTRAAIRSFQQRSGLAADGVVGPRTEAALRAAGAPPPPGAVGGAGATTAKPGCPPQLTFVDCPPPGTRPTEVLDNFQFDRTALSPTLHVPKIAALAARIVRSNGAIRSVLIAGHTDPAGDDNYNFDLARRRALEVASELCRALERIRPGIAGSIRFNVTSCGERQTKPTPGQSRRVEIFYAPSGPGRAPPDHDRCGVPSLSPRQEIGLEAETTQLRQAAQRRRTAQSRLSLFQNASNSSHRNHFECQAVRQATRMAAIASPDAANCQRRVGATPYDTGANIIAAIEAARTCTGSLVNTIHIFSHSGSHGVFGSASGGSVGLYRDDSVSADQRAAGARSVADIPLTPLAQNVVVVLHGCNTANGDASFALALFQRLRTSLNNPRVFAHANGGCCGRDNSWREFSTRAPAGRVVRTIAPHYQGDGCCSAAA